MNSVIGDVTNECINVVYQNVCKQKNQRKFNSIIQHISDIAFKDIKPYLYTIVALIVIIFVINLILFYYYIKVVLVHNIHMDSLISHG